MMAFRNGRSVSERKQIAWDEIPDEAIDISKIRNLRTTVLSVVSSSVADGTVTLSKLKPTVQMMIRRAVSLASTAVQQYSNASFLGLKARSVKLKHSAISSSTAVGQNDGTFYSIDASGGAVTITLPGGGKHPGLMFAFKKVDSSGNAMIIDGKGPQTIDGATTVSITTQYQSILIVSNGTNWVIMANKT